MQRILPTVMVWGLLLLFSGCSSTIGNLQEYMPAPLRKTEFMPSNEALHQAKTKVILVRLNNGGNKVAQRANLAQVLNTSLIGILSSDGSVELIDRSVDARLNDEIKLHEFSRQEEDVTSALRLASYAVKGDIATATFASRYVKARVWYDKKGTVHRTPAYFVYTARVNGVLSVYEIPSMKLLKSFEFYGNSSYTKESRYPERFNAELVQQAGRNGIYNVQMKLKRLFAPKGYILYKRVRDDRVIYEVSLGALDGLQEGDDVTIFRKERFRNPISNEERLREIIIASGHVSEIVHPHSAWIILDEMQAGYDIRLGDYMKKRYSSWY